MDKTDEADWLRSNYYVRKSLKKWKGRNGKRIKLLSKKQKKLLNTIMTDKTSSESILHQAITEQIIKAYYAVYNELGYGFLERVHQNAMFEELRDLGFAVECQKKILVHYKEKIVGEYFADIVVDNKVIIELKASESIISEHEIQLLNYLRATEIEVGLLLNFGKKAAFRRKICTNDAKKLNLY